MSEFDCIIQIETVKNVQTIKGGERMLLEERLDEIVKIERCPDEQKTT